MQGSIEHHIISELNENLVIKRRDIPKHLLITPGINYLLKNAALDWFMVIFFWVVIIYLPIWIYPLSAILIASRFHSFGVILHDATHMSMKRKTFRFRLLEILVGYPIGSTINAMRYHHLRHHKDSGMPSDPYFKKEVDGNKVIKYLFILKAFILAPFWTLRGLYGTLAFYVKPLRNSYAKIFLQDKSGKDCSQSKEVIQCASEDRFQLIFHLIIYSALIWAPRFFLLAYFIPVLLSGIFAGYRLLNEHNYIETTDRKMETIIATTRDNHLKGILRFFLAPKNIGYHIVHHLHPQVAWYKLPELREWYLENCNEIYTGAEQKCNL
ncbi:MAG: fatty acid desaturase [Ginsengibacter sp.]